MSKSVGHNSDLAIDFNSEVSGAMNATTTSEGREIKLAAVVYLSPEVFNVNHILNADNKSERIRETLAAQSSAFADKMSKLEDLKVERKTAGMARREEIAFEVDLINKQTASARAMLERALICAYFLKSVDCVIHKVNAKYIDLQYRTPRKLNENVKPIEREKLTRGDLYKFGRDLLTKNGVIKTREAKGNGSKPVSLRDKLREVNTISDNMKVLSDTIAPMLGESKDAFIADDATTKLAATLFHKLFAHDGTIEARDVIAFIRANVSNVKVEGFGTAPTSRKPVDKAA